MLMKKKLNNHWIVQSNISMWSDAYLDKKIQRNKKSKTIKR